MLLSFVRICIPLHLQTVGGYGEVVWWLRRGYRVGILNNEETQRGKGRGDMEGYQGWKGGTGSEVDDFDGHV